MITNLLNTYQTAAERQTYRSIDGSSLLHLATSENHLDVIFDLVHIYGLDPNVLNGERETALITACKGQLYQACDLLLKLGSDPNAISARDDSALLWAAYKGNVWIAKLLIAHGAAPAHLYCDGKDMFLWAVLKDRMDVVRYIFDDIEIDINMKDKDGKGWEDLCVSDAMYDMITSHKKLCTLYLMHWFSRGRVEILERSVIRLIVKFTWFDK